MDVATNGIHSAQLLGLGPRRPQSRVRDAKEVWDFDNFYSYHH
jgi:hypothetical protein